MLQLPSTSRPRSPITWTRQPTVELLALCKAFKPSIGYIPFVTIINFFKNKYPEWKLTNEALSSKKRNIKPDEEKSLEQSVNNLLEDPEFKKEVVRIKNLKQK